MQVASKTAGVMLGLMMLASAAVPSFADDPPPGCTKIPPTSGGTVVCREGSTVSVEGKTDEEGIREFFQYPMGKSPESVPQVVGRGVEKGVAATGKGVEHLSHEIGKTAARIFGW
jgi:hypothetical protein